MKEFIDACPQFSATLGNRIEGLQTEISKLGDSRNRMAISEREPEGFVTALAVAFDVRMDVFLLNPAWSEAEMANVLSKVRPDLLIEEGCVSFGSETNGEKSIWREPVIAIPTGGSSGQIKFAVHTRTSLGAAVSGLVGFLGGSVISSYCTLPLYHVSGFMQLYRALITGGRCVFGGPDVSGELLTEIKCLSLVGTQLHRMLEDEAALAGLKEFDIIFLGGGPLSDEDSKRAREVELPLAPTYGMTETAAQVATMKPGDFLRGAEGVGHALPHVKMKIENPDTVGIGRILIRSKALYLGYFCEELLVKDWYATSDRGSIDKDENVRVVGRLDRVVISGGENISVDEVEGHCSGIDGVEVCHGFGMKDAEWGELLCLAFVGSLSEDELKERLRKNLTSLKVPKVVLKLDELPRNDAGKIDVFEIRKLMKDLGLGF